jgi:SAM-dependent methyltransferase
VTTLSFDDAAAAYDRAIADFSRLFVPALLDAAGVGPRDRVLDVATATGLAAAAARARAGPAGRLLGADLSLPMLVRARDRLGSTPVLGADGQALPFRPASFDVVLCHLGLSFFPSPDRGLAEFHRVLRPGGRLAVSVLTTPDRMLYGRVFLALARHRSDSRATLSRLCSLGDPGRLATLLSGAGFGAVRVGRAPGVITFPSTAASWAVVEAGAGLAGQAYLELGPGERRAVRDEVVGGLAAEATASGLNLPVETLVAAGERRA